MKQELLVLALGALLLIVHIMAAIRAKTAQYGTDWNMGARDGDMPPLNDVAGRLERARDNFAETLPVAIIALLGVVVAGKDNGWSTAGSWLWLAARTIYLPMYWAGVPKVRTLVWASSMIGLLTVLGVLVFG